MKKGITVMDRRKIRALLFLVICLTAFAGCKKKHVGTEEDNAAPRQEEEEQTVYRFGFSCSTKQNSYYETLRESISEELRKEGHILIGNNEDAGMDAGKQIEQIGQMIEQEIDVIFLIPVDWKEITPALEALEEADVKIINLDTQVADLDLTDAYIGTDNKEAGALCGKALIDRYPQGGKIAILECPTINSINDRITGFEEALAGNPFEVVARVDAAGRRKRRKQRRRRSLRRILM